LDKVLDIYDGRLKRLAQAPPSSDWDGVYAS
jgi:hypothetical protein